jgi:endonuclease I
MQIAQVGLSNDPADHFRHCLNRVTHLTRLFPLAAALCAPLLLVAPAVQGASLDRLDGSALKEAVSAIAARGHRPLSYRELWDVLKQADAHPSRQGFVVGLYSRAVIPAECTEGKAPSSCAVTWNREHVWPKSKSFPRREQWAHTDAHHVVAEVVRCNSLRGNLDFEEGGQLDEVSSDIRN